MTEPVIYREEVVRLLFSVYDIGDLLSDIRDVLVEEDNGEQEDEG